MKTWTILSSAALGLALAGCATHVSKSKQQQVQLATQTGIYSYQRALSPPGAPR
ncbi:MAG TPA: hypothetical protein VGC39_10255 [Candidatus Methylacidiphilales bacterium]